MKCPVKLRRCVKSLPRFVVAIAGMTLCCVFGPAHVSAAIITNDVFAKDTSGNPIYAQGGGVFKFNGIYYWYGVKYNGAVTYYNDPWAGQNDNSSFAGISCYSSTNLVDWKFERLSTTGLSAGWVGRMGVCYNTNTQQYVMISQRGAGVQFATSSTPNGTFVFHHTQTTLPVVNNSTGDQTIFIDDDGTPYVICSSASGRSHLYVLPLRASDYLNVEAGTEIYSGNGREGNCMFKYNGKYYFCSSDLHGWNASHCYVLESTSTNIMGPYLPEYVMDRTDLDFCHVTQTGFFYTVQGTNDTTVLFVGDRWCDFGGNGIGYNQWCPLTFNGTKPTFQSVSVFDLDAAAGTWSVAPGNNYILNPAYEADRVTQTSVAGWINTGSGFGNASGSGHVPGDFHFRHFSGSPYAASTRQLVTGLPNGTYNLSVWHKSSGGQSTARIFARNFGGAQKNANINTAQPVWTQVSITNIPVINGQCDVGLDSVAGANQSVDIDDWSLTLVGPPPPSGLTANSGDAQVPLNWNVATNATGYKVKRATTNGGPYSVIASPTVNNFTDNTVVNGTTYFYVVSSTNDLGESPDSAQVSVMPSAGPIISAASASPNPVYPGQDIFISATVTAQANPIAEITVDASAVGGLAGQILVPNGTGAYTNTITVDAMTSITLKILTVNGVDDLGNISAPFSFALTIGAATTTWDGGADDDNWSSGANWVGDTAPGFGYSLTFAGSARLTPLMDSSYNVHDLLFDSTAGDFNINGLGGTLTLSGSVTNNSASPQTLDVPVVLSAPATFNAAAGDLTLGETINNGGNLLTITDGGSHTAVNGAISGNGGFTKSGGGTNTLFGVNTFLGDTTISGGGVTIGGAGQLGAGFYSGAIANNGTLTYDSSAAQTLSGVVSGPGGLNKTGSGLLTLAAANLFSGPTRITEGTLRLTSPLALQSSALDYNSGNLSFSAITSVTLAGLHGTNEAQDFILNNLASGAVGLSVGGNNASVLYAGNLSGSGSLTKNGTGTLTLANANYTGATTINGGGVLAVYGGSFGSPASLITINSAASGGTVLILSNCTATASTVTLGISGGSTGVSAALRGNSSASFGGLTIGSSGNTPGNLTIATTGNVGLGNVLINRNAGAVTTGSTGAGLIVNNGTVAAASVSIGQNGVAGRGADLNLNGGSLTIADAAATGKFAINSSAGNGFITMTGGALTYLGTDGLLMSVGSGVSRFTLSGGTATLAGITLNSGNFAATTNSLVVSNGATLYLGSVGLVLKQPGGNVFASLGNGGATVGALTNWSSVAPITLAGITAFKAADALGAARNISLGGVLSGAGGINKTGAGALTLSGTNTYTGATTVSAGTLSVNGRLTGVGAVTVANGGTLGGAGIIRGATTVQNGGTFAPGASIGTLTFSNSLTLASGSTSLFEITKSPLTNDVARLFGALTCGGTLIVTNISAGALAAGDSFKLFEATSYNGSFANILLPALASGLAWNTDALNTSGTISVVTATPPAPPVFGSMTLLNDSLVFTGSSGVAGANFYLLGSSNLAAPLNQWEHLLTNQFDANGNFNFTNPVNPMWPQGFYLLELP